MSDKLIEAAKLPNIGYSEKDWDKTAASVTPGFVYDEVATHRKSEGVEGYLDLCKGWATAFHTVLRDIYTFIASGRGPNEPRPPAFATFEDGYRINRIVDAILASSTAGGVWTPV